MSSVLEKAMTEDELLQAVGDALTLYRWRWTHSRRSDRAQTMGAVGLPDIIAVRDNRLAFIELKAENGKLRPEQKAWIGDLSRVAYGGRHLHHARPVPETWVIRPSQLDMFLREIAR